MGIRRNGKILPVQPHNKTVLRNMQYMVLKRTHMYVTPHMVGG